MNRRFITLLLIIGIATVNLCACSSTPKPLGITSGNHNNWGIYASDEEWIYYTNETTDFHLFRMKHDGSESSEVLDDFTLGLNVIEGWIYFIGTSTMGLYKMKTDGTEMTRIGTTAATPYAGLVVQGDTLFYINMDNYYISSIKTDGTQQTNLTTFPVYKFTVDGDWVYFVNQYYGSGDDAHESKIMKIKTTGGQASVVVDDHSTNLIVHEGWIYYTSDANNGWLYRVRTNGKDQKKLANYTITSLNLFDDKLVFTTATDPIIRTCNLDGTGLTKFLEVSAMGLWVLDQRLYFKDILHSGRLYSTNFEGTDLQKAQTLPLVEPDPVGTPIVTGIGRPNSGNGLAIKYEDWLIYASNSHVNHLYKMKIDGTEMTEILPHSVQFINRIGDWIYFIDVQNYFSIARVRMDGTQYGVIYDEPCSELLVIDDWMYFVDTSDSYYIYKIRVDGTQLTQLYKEGAQMLSISGDQLFYIKTRVNLWEPDYEGILRIYTSGGGKTKITPNSIGMMIVDGDRIYYTTTITSSGNIGIRSLALNGTNDVLVIDNANLLGVHEGWVYYVDAAMNVGLKRVRVDGSSTQTLLDHGYFFALQVLDDKLVVVNDEDMQMYIMNLDGSDFISVTP